MGGREKDEHTLVVIDNIAQMITSAVMSFAHTHRVMSEVDIAIIALKDMLASYICNSRNWSFRFECRKYRGAFVLCLQKTVRVISI